jgi:hypothetical protein
MGGVNQTVIKVCRGWASSEWRKKWGVTDDPESADNRIWSVRSVRCWTTKKKERKWNNPKKPTVRNCSTQLFVLLLVALTSIILRLKLGGVGRGKKRSKTSSSLHNDGQWAQSRSREHEHERETEREREIMWVITTRLVHRPAQPAHTLGGQQNQKETGWGGGGEMVVVVGSVVTIFEHSLR